MLKRSLQTFMNAFTSLDWTAYPFSTQNEKDFQNLLSVYLDATFFPNLRHHDFLQEGHRFEFQDKADPSSGLKYSGVVYNEMKGAMSDPQRVFIQELTSKLFPDTSYRYNSGGDPAAIPSLTYEQFCSFHKQYYHPSNSNLFTYGDLPPHLEPLDSVLSRFDKADPVPPVPLQSLWSEPRRMYATCPEDAMIPDPERQTKMIRAWVTPDLAEVDDIFGMHILASLLLDDPSAPFYKTLIEPNIGQSFAPGSGFCSDERQSVFGVGLTGIKDSDVERVDAIIQSTLEQCLEEGFDPERIEAVLHQIEIGQRHVSTGFGLSVFLRMVPYLNHQVQPFTALELSEKLMKLRKNLEAGDYFESLIRKYLLQNQHHLTLVMNPDPEYTKKKQAEEEGRLSAARAGLSAEEGRRIVELNATLESHQGEPQNTDVLPTLHVSDIAWQGTYYDTEEMNVNGLSVLKSVQPTNGMVYLRAMVDAHALPEELRPYLPLFSSCLSSMGAGEMDYRELAHQIKLKTRDVSCAPSAYNNFRGSDQGYAFHLMLNSSCLARNTDAMFDLFNKVIQQPNFNFPDRLETLLSDMALGEAQSLVDSGHSYAMACASARMSPAHALSETMSGLTQVRFLNELAAKLPGNVDDIIAKLDQIAGILLKPGLGRVMVAADEVTWSAGKIDSLLQTLPAHQYFGYINPQPRIIPPASKTYVGIPMQVNHNALVLPGVPTLHEDSAALTLAARLLRWNFLHQQIREKGGAYGAGAALGSETFSFFSYRDPNVAKTLETFEQSIDWLCAGDYPERDIEEGLLSVFSDIDSPKAPSRRGLTTFLDGMPKELRQQKRENLLQLNRDKIVDVATRVLKPNFAQAQVAVCGVKDADMKTFESQGFSIVHMD